MSPSRSCRLPPALMPDVGRFSLAWTHLVTQALSPADSAGMITTLAKETP
jgi:hypothetical protein